VVRITPWQTQRRILICAKILSRTPFSCWANPSPSGVTAFFVLQWATLTVQSLWVCELTDNGWKQIPGSICVFPEVVPIFHVVSKSPHSLPLSVYSPVWVLATVISDTILIIAPLMVWQISPLSSSVWTTPHQRIQIARGLRVRALRFRLFSIFSVSIATTLASLAHAILVIVKPGVWNAVFGTATLISSPVPHGLPYSPLTV
jgi:hypothetical protein